MSHEEYAFALKSTLNEIKNVCPDIFHSFIFGEGAIVVTQDDETNQADVIKAANTLNSLLTETGNAIGGIKSVTIQTEKNRVYVTATSDLYSTTIADKAVDRKYLNTLNQILIPTVIRLVDKINKENSNSTLLDVEKPEPLEPIDEQIELEKKPEKNQLPEEEIVSIDEELEPEHFFPEPTATQLIIEKAGGLLTATDTVQLDNDMVLQWKDTYDNKKITKVDIETLTGRTTRCKYKPLKGKKQNGRGIIKIPKKIQLIIEAHEGELVMVKPVVE